MFFHFMASSKKTKQKKKTLYALISSQHKKERVGNTIIEQCVLVVFWMVQRLWIIRSNKVS